MEEQGSSVDSQLQEVQVEIEESKLKDIVSWLDTEIRRASADRQKLDDKILEWDRLYEAIPEEEVKMFPWEGCSNLVVPVIATAVEAVQSRLINAVFAGKDLFVGQPKSPNWVDLAEPVGRWLNWVSSSIMKMYPLCQRWFLSTVKYGTGIVKLPWVERFRNVKYMQNGGLYQERVTLHNGPLPELVRLENFLFSPDAVTSQDIQTCEWVAQKSVRTFKYLKEMENSEVYQNVDEIKENKRQNATDIESQIEARTGIEPSERNDYEIYEVWCSYDVEGNGELSELVITFHLDTRTVLRAVHNFYRHQERPFHIIRYMPRDNSLLGIGICQMLEDIQEEVSTIHNQRLDNATLSNTRAWKRRQGSGANIDEVYPGAVVDVIEMDDVQELQMGNPHSSLLQEEIHTGTIGEKRTGVSDYTVGRESAAIGSRATATSTMALLNEGNKRFQMTIMDIRDALSSFAHQVIMLYQQFAPEGEVMYEMFSEKEKTIVKEYLHLPPEDTRDNVHIDVPALSETRNKDIQQQHLIMLMQMIHQFYEGLMQAVGMAISPEAPPEIKMLAGQAASTGSEIFKRILESFDFVDAEKFAPDIESILNMQQGLESMQNQMSALGGQDGATAETGFRPQGEGAPHDAGAGTGQQTLDISESEIMSALSGAPNANVPQ